MDIPAAQLRFDSEPMPIDQLFAEINALSEVPRVGRQEALSVSTVQRGRNLLCSIATLPLVQRNANNEIVRNPLLEQIDPDVANVVTMAQTVEDLLFEATAWWRITAFGFDGFPVTAQRIDSSSVSLTPPGGQTPAPLPSGEDPRRAVLWVDGKEVPWSEIIRFDSPNPGVLKVGGRAIKRAILLDQAARLYADDPRPLDYFTPTDGADPAEDDEIQEIIDKWRSARKRRATGYVPAAMAYNTVDVPSPSDLQLVELQKQAALDIANAFGLDPEELGVSTTSRTYANVIDRRRDKINDVLSPYMRAITDRLSMPDVTKRGYRVEFNLDDYMKSNPTERWSVYEKAKSLGVYDVEDIRRKEGEPPQADTQSDPAPVISIVPDNVSASDRPAHGFKNQTSHQFSFSGADFEFAVDSEKRTIAGLALPYNKVGVKYGMKFRFKPGSLQWAETSRVKHFKDHMTPVGKALELKDTRRALMAKLSVGRGATGDELLQLAEDGVYDGMSVGVDFNLDPDSGDVQLARDGVYDVLRADLREITTTAMPAFDDARVTKVAASRGGGDMDKCATCGQEHAPNVACPTTTPPALEQTPAGLNLSADTVTALLNHPNGQGALATLLGTQAPEPQPAQEERPVVNPTRLAASAAVEEAVPYRFDRKGNLTRGSHDFSTDLYAHFTSHDQAAGDRAMEFIRAQFDVATGDVNELNPTRQRPDMYVDQRSFRYPVWEAIDKGTLGDITPFQFPKFNSASGLVANHTEGTEPSSGTFTTTGQTVTPTAVSGKAKIRREVWDQGGNPQVSNLIWNQMTKAWYEALEAFAVATLDAETPTAIALTAGGADAALVDELSAAMTLLQFVRGGFSMTDAFTQVDLYKALAAASDLDGRKLLPVIGATNAVGTAQSRWAALDVGGTLFYPAWALAASGDVVASSYLFDRDSVHGWASAPQRLDITMTEVANVYIGLWGYKAAAISDLAGVREITYDPTGP